MTKNKETKKILQTKILSNGIKVEADVSKANGHLLMKCRELSGGVSTVIYIISEIATFDGEKIPAPEILDMNALTVMELEAFWGELMNIQAQSPILSE